MGRIADTWNPWNEDDKHAAVSVVIENSAGKFYVVATPKTEEEDKLCFVAKDKEGIRMLVAALNTAIRQLDKLLNEGE